MLNQEDQRRLDEIEQYLELSDPRLARRMRPGGGRGRWLIFLIPVLSAPVALLALTHGWVVATGVAVAVLAVANLAALWWESPRRRRRAVTSAGGMTVRPRRHRRA